MNLKPLFYVLCFTAQAGNGVAANDHFEGIKPTGKWYTNAIIDYMDLDGCFLPGSPDSTKYDAIFSSFEAGKETLFRKKYKGGTCNEFISARSEQPQDWPLSPHGQWTAFLETFSDASRVMDINYHCMRSKDAADDYWIHFTLQPQYKCPDGTCSAYRQACSGDVYAGDLQMFPAERLGHTGIIYAVDNEDTKNPWLVMEVLNKPPIIHIGQPLTAIREERLLWGVRYGYGKLNAQGEMSYFDTLKMSSLGFIQSQYCPQYTLKPTYHVGKPVYNLIKNPITQDTFEITTVDCAVFRCDTFVQYLYKEVLDTDLPPRDILQAPKDLFNAFPNQRGDALEQQNRPVMVEPLDRPNANQNSQALWALYREHKKSPHDLASHLDAIDDLPSIPFEELIKEIRDEKNDEIKSKLLYMAAEKIKTQPVNKENWVFLKELVLNALHHAVDPRVLVNALIVGELMFTPEELIVEINLLRTNGLTQFSPKDMTMVSKSINLTLFEILINSDSKKIQNEVIYIISKMDRDSITDSFSVFINEFPEKKLSSVKEYFHQYLINSKSDYFHSKDFVKNNYRANLWSKALFKTVDNDVTAVTELIGFLNKIDDRFVQSLLILENKEIITSNLDKLHAFDIMNRRKKLTFENNSPMEKMVIEQANRYVSIH